MSNMLLIIGASGHGKVVADIALKSNQWETIAFLDEDESIKSCLGLEVIGKASDVFTYKQEVDFFVAIGNNAKRERIQEKLTNEGLSVVALIHPSAVIGTDVEIGKGTVIMAGAVINSSTKIGNGCIINTGATVDHDNIIEDYVHVSPGVSIAGSVRIDNGTWLGIGSVVSNNISICDKCIIGAGTVVIKNITEPGTYVGVPGRKV